MRTRNGRTPVWSKQVYTLAYYSRQPEWNQIEKKPENNCV